MLVAPPASTPPENDGPADRNRWLLPGLGVLAAVSAVIAAVVIFSSGGSATPADDSAAQVRTSDESLIVGPPDAPTKVVVFEDFGGSASREFEIASRDFLEVEAAQGNALVEYRPFSPADGYSRLALEAWAAVLQHGTAQEAMAFHGLLFDRQPSAAGTAPTVAELDAWAVEAGAEQGVVSEGLQHPDSALVDASREVTRAAGVEVAPTVIVDGRALARGSGVELADRLQRQILED
jgi:protein-disulfide isomerase